MSEAASDEVPTLLSFSTPEGHAFVRKTLLPLLPYEPHQYQLEGVCKSLDGVDLLAVLATGGGKTGFFSMYMLVVLALSKNPSLCNSPRKDIPKDPAMVVVCPTNGLEEDMAGKFTALGLRTLVINQDTVLVSKRQRQDLWSLAQSDYAIIIMSPEMFIRREFDELLKCHTFSARLMALGIDEVHLMNSWGKGFRPCFTQLGFVRARMAKRTTLIALTATLGAGPATQNVCKFLGLEAGHFYFLKRSNLRPDLQIVFRTLAGGLGGWSFPDFKHVIRGNRKTLIFCATIAQSFRLALYLISIAPATPDPTKRIRMYNSLNWADYNAETREVFQQQPDVQIIIATNSLMVGVDLENVADVIIAGEPEDVDALLQKAGRAGRNRHLVNDARGIVYVTKGSLAAAHALLDGKKITGRKKKGGKEETMDPDMARMLIADCKSVEQNRYYDNPADDSPCSCATCMENPLPTRETCNCSGCQPEEPVLPAIRKRKVHEVPQKLRLTRDMRSIATERLRQLRWTLYTGDSSVATAMLPPSVYLPDSVIKTILDRFALLNEISDLDPLIETHTYVIPHRARIWLSIEALGRHFEGMRKEQKQRQRQCMDPEADELEEESSRVSDVEEPIEEPAGESMSQQGGQDATTMRVPTYINPSQVMVSSFPTSDPPVLAPLHNTQVVQQYPGCFVSSFRLGLSEGGSTSTRRHKRHATQVIQERKGKRPRTDAGGKENISES